MSAKITNISSKLKPHYSYKDREEENPSTPRQDCVSRTWVVVVWKRRFLLSGLPVTYRVMLVVSNTGGVHEHMSDVRLVVY